MGSTNKTAIFFLSFIKNLIRWFTIELFPAPGGPVIPILNALFLLFDNDSSKSFLRELFSSIYVTALEIHLILFVFIPFII